MDAIISYSEELVFSGGLRLQLLMPFPPCPECQGKLRYDADFPALICMRCGRTFFKTGSVGNPKRFRREGGYPTQRGPNKRNEE